MLLECRKWITVWDDVYMAFLWPLMAFFVSYPSKWSFSIEIYLFLFHLKVYCIPTIFWTLLQHWEHCVVVKWELLWKIEVILDIYLTWEWWCSACTCCCESGLQILHIKYWQMQVLKRIRSCYLIFNCIIVGFNFSSDTI